ncbi:serine-threonine kinase STK5 [Canna indica]|uniref:non-specific serine/threonine protein kinase n=1 Tax=Canna indica TaxID=4628 RepID=A0AAQ3JSJ2_9LILI|nr:serine-threonine kinase STK5 [Canna indica]
MERIKREISVMRLVRHPNIVHLFEVMASKGKIYLVMEYVKGGELFDKITKGGLQEDVARKYFQQLVIAVDYCHSRGVYHRDLKPENLLVDGNGNLKVSDFGLSALADSKRQDGLLHTICGTPAYVAPEVISRIGYDGAKADIWSCGVVLYVLLAGFLPFHDSNLMEMYRKIGRSEFRFPSWFSYDARKLISKILDPNPITRISIATIKENKWFKKGFSDKKLKSKAVTEDTLTDVAAAFNSLDSSSSTNEAKQDSVEVTNLNAFDIIALSTGFSLSGLFQKDHKKEARFTSKASALAIISKIEDLVKHLKLKIKKKDIGVLKIEGCDDGRKGVLAIDVEIFEVIPALHLVEMKKSNGDTLEYQNLLKEGIRPALQDIVWTWQGD